MSVPGTVPASDKLGDGASDVPCLGGRARIIIVANMLPIQVSRDAKSREWCFSRDEDSMLLQLQDGFSSGTEFVYVGSLNASVDLSEQEEVAEKLLADFNCVPTYLAEDLQEKFYRGFCKQHLWTLLHYLLPVCPSIGPLFDPSLWRSYVSANKIFADKVVRVINPEYDYVWIQDYHLMVLPTFLRKRYYRIKLGFFLHSPFPSSEIYRTLPVREEVLRGLLNCDLIGFHTFDYAQHFLACCHRLLGLDYGTKRGHMGLEYLGRTVYVKILPAGVHLGRLESVLNLPSTSGKVREIQERFKGKKVILGVDDLDVFKGISHKILALEHLFKTYQHMQGKVVLVQILNPARASGKDVEAAKEQTYAAVQLINECYGSHDYKPVVLIDRLVPRDEKTAYYSVAECCVVNAVRDGMNLVPYKYTVCRQGTMGIGHVSPRESTLVVSEFIGCSPSLSGAIRVNPWNTEAVSEAVNSALHMNENEMQQRHAKHYKNVSTHDVGYWAKSFMQDLEMACLDHHRKRYWGIGFGLGFRVLSLSPSFERLSVEHVVSAYRRTGRRAIFLDYDGTLVPENSIIKSPSKEVFSVLRTLCSDPRNTVFIVSGRGRNSLDEWLAPCEGLGIAAEHGYFIRWSSQPEWETCCSSANVEWKAIVESVMQSYMDATDGSSIECKESALVWHYKDADPDFAACQAKELLDHLKSILADEPVAVKRGQHIVEVKPQMQEISKGVVVQRVLSRMFEAGIPPDFVMCIGDDKSDEDMFETLLDTSKNPSLLSNTEIFACTVGKKPSKAKYFLDNMSDVPSLLGALAAFSAPTPTNQPQTHRIFRIGD